MPTLIANHRAKQLETSLKRNYSLVSQALDMYAAENGERAKAGDFEPQMFSEMLKKYIKVIRDCNVKGVPHIACIPNNSNIDNTKVYQTYNGGELYMNLFDDGQLIMPDGSLLLIENAFQPIYISIDVNGFNKKPNRLGHDLFIFSLDTSGRLLPGGVEGFYYSKNDEYCSLNSTANVNGAGCTYKALYEKDYFKNLPK